MTSSRIDRTFIILFLVMFTIAAGNTALQSVLPALGRSLSVPDSAVAAAFSVSALLWTGVAPFWANRADRYGRRRMVLLGMTGLVASLALCGLFLTAGINGWIAPVGAFAWFIAARMIYGGFGAAAPPAVQAIVAARTSREERTRALTLIGSAFGLGTIVGPAVAPYLVLGHAWPGGPEIGLAGPALIGAVGAMAMLAATWYWLPREVDASAGHGAVSSYPSIGGQASGASVTAATADRVETIGFLDRRVRAWMICGLVLGHAQAAAGQVIGFLVIDRLGVAPVAAIEATGLVLMMGAGAALLAQWGIIPLLNLSPRGLMLSGLTISAVGCVATGSATTLYGIATGYALTTLGFGFSRPGFTAGSSLAVGQGAQGSVAGKVTSINGAAFILGPSIGVALYQLWRPLPYLGAAALLALLVLYGWFNLRPSSPATEASPGR
ncbi:MFS transporter [Sphingomonas turrisvirgatae]|uniref:MFS transporter n=1 Tax=Sphingomonas turrisvirgatae TaxID=1888892 RepID=A0A1E3LQB6_9SPHN|nr:MFS transporter [Sphingomonas turrisvirgatae]ODP35946.1 MFS transporter [Sphingomonas turrisvirgatae]